MALVNCPECDSQISENALMCPHCGYSRRGRLYGFEYKSKVRLFGMPLVHVAFGVNPATGAPRVARGFIAVGNIAIGVVALGGVALGGIALGGVSLALLAALGGLAVGGLLALGGLAVGTVAIGGLAVGYYAMGGAAFGAHPLGANAEDAEALEFFKRTLGDWVEQVTNRPHR